MLKQSSKKYIHTDKSPQTKPGLTHTISLPAFWQRPYCCKIPPRSPSGNILQQNDIIPIGGKGKRVAQCGNKIAVGVSTVMVADHIAAPRRQRDNNFASFLGY